MSKNIDYSQWGPYNDVGTNTEPHDGCICSNCSGTVSNTNLQHFGMAVSQTTNLATTVPIISCELHHKYPAQDKKTPSLSETSSKRSENEGSSKNIKNKKTTSKLKAPSQKPEVLERKKRKKNRLLRSVTVATTENNSDEGSDVGIDSDHSATSGNLQQKHKNAASERKKKQMKKKLSGKRINGNTSDSFEKEQEKEMDIDNGSCISSLADKPKNKVIMQDGPCNATVTSSKNKSTMRKKKNVCGKFCYIIETTTPLPYGTFAISVDKNSITPCGDSDDELNECSCDECKAGTSSGQKNCKRVSNYKMFVQKYKNKSACKRASKKRR